MIDDYDDMTSINDMKHMTEAAHDVNGTKALKVFESLRNKSSSMSKPHEKLPTLHQVENTNEAEIKKSSSRRRSWESILLPNGTGFSKSNDWEKVREEFMGKGRRHQ